MTGVHLPPSPISHSQQKVWEPGNEIGTNPRECTGVTMLEAHAVRVHTDSNAAGLM